MRKYCWSFLTFEDTNIWRFSVVYWNVIYMRTETTKKVHKNVKKKKKLASEFATHPGAFLVPSTTTTPLPLPPPPLFVLNPLPPRLFLLPGPPLCRLFSPLEPPFQLLAELCRWRGAGDGVGPEIFVLVAVESRIRRLGPVLKPRSWSLSWGSWWRRQVNDVGRAQTSFVARSRRVEATAQTAILYAIENCQFRFHFMIAASIVLAFSGVIKDGMSWDSSCAR